MDHVNGYGEEKEQRQRYIVHYIFNRQCERPMEQIQMIPHSHRRYESCQVDVCHYKASAFITASPSKAFFMITCSKKLFIARLDLFFTWPYVPLNHTVKKNLFCKRLPHSEILLIRTSHASSAIYPSIFHIYHTIYPLRSSFMDVP